MYCRSHKVIAFIIIEVNQKNKKKNGKDKTFKTGFIVEFINQSKIPQKT